MKDRERNHPVGVDRHPPGLTDTTERAHISAPIRWLIWLFAVLYVLFPQGGAAACSLAEPYVEIVCERNNDYFQKTTVCIDAQCSLMIIPIEELVSTEELDRYDNSHVLMKDDYPNWLGTFEGNKFEYLKFRSLDIQIIGEICQEFTDEDMSIIEEYYQNYMSSQDAWNFKIEPYTERLEKKLEHEIRQRESKLLYCTTYVYEHVGKWLVSYDDYKEYCYDARTNECPYSMVAYNPILLAVYLIKYPSWITVPILLGLLLIIGMAFYLFKRREIRVFIKPNKFTILILLLVFVLRTYLSYFLWNSAQNDVYIDLGILDALNFFNTYFSWIFLLTYIIFSTINYTIYRKKLSKSSEVTP